MRRCVHRYVSCFTLCFLLRGRAQQSTASNDTLATKFGIAKGLLSEAFSTTGTLSLDPLLDALGLLGEIASFVTRVIRGGYMRQLYDDEGNPDYYLTDDDELMVEEYMSRHVFVLLDLLPLVLMTPEELASALVNEMGHPLLKRSRIASAMRLSWWTSLTTNESILSVPWFGSLASLARSLRALHSYNHDVYREGLLSLVSSTSPLATMPVESHLQVQQEYLMSWAWSRPRIFRKSCAWLAEADSRAKLEMAEQFFRSVHHSSMKTLLFAAAEWPIFDLLHRIAINPPGARGLPWGSPFEDPNYGVRVSSLEPSIDLSPNGYELAAGKQRLPPHDILEYYRMFHVVKVLFKAYHVRYWVSHGTLIGALRDAGLSIHADDFEIDVPERDVENLQGPQLRGAFARNGYELSYDPRGRCFKVWPAGSRQAPRDGGQLDDQSWWLPQQYVGTPALDIYLVQTPGEGQGADRLYVSNAEFHCNVRICTRFWKQAELQSFHEVPFGMGAAMVPVGAADYLERAYGDDWNVTVRPHRWASQHGETFEATEVAKLSRRAAEPFGPLPQVFLP